ncbi:MAG: ATP-binding cassette domain-containing protein [Patescibacteria group bacterium]|jgi:ABC-2 type transport system ATP-binding protein|nr:ATP-binding cassette domain-containing protein [Patescibacteria group bacterium]
MTKRGNAIEIKDIRKSFGTLEVLKGINFVIPRGSIVALLGPNGAGKTTLIRILSTLLTPDAGQATIEGFDVVDEADNVRGVIGLTGQYAAIDEYLSGRENLEMMGHLYHLSKPDTKKRAAELLEKFDLADAANRPAKTYSGGMSRRLDLASSLIASPPILFFDEPTTGLDPRSRLMMWEIIDNLTKEGATILLTTQYLDEADQLADRIAVLDGGMIIAEGTPNQLKAKVGNERIEFEFDSLECLKKAEKIISNDSILVNEEKYTLSVANDKGVKKLKSLLEEFEKSNITVVTLSLHKPTLDDVFLKLTGHQATAEELAEEEKEPKKGKK